MSLMEKHLLLNVLFIFSLSLKSIAQPSTDELLSKVWQFKMATSIVETDRLGNAVDPPNSDIAERDYQFRVINITEEGNLVIRFLHWNATTIAKKREPPDSKVTNRDPNSLNSRFRLKDSQNANSSGNKEKNLRYFRISRADFDIRCEEKLPPNQFSVGATTLPIKVRFGEKNQDGTNKSYTTFSGNISVGMSFGLKHNYNKTFAINYLGGFSLSSIPVSAETTNSYVDEETNQAALTWHLGILAEINNFQIGVFTGIDYLSGKINKEWIYKDKPWLGVGIGFSFFNAKKTTDTQ